MPPCSMGWTSPVQCHAPAIDGHGQGKAECKSIPSTISQTACIASNCITPLFCAPCDDEHHLITVMPKNAPIFISAAIIIIQLCRLVVGATGEHPTAAIRLSLWWNIEYNLDIELLGERNSDPCSGCGGTTDALMLFANLEAGQYGCSGSCLVLSASTDMWELGSFCQLRGEPCMWLPPMPPGGWPSYSLQTLTTRPSNQVRMSFVHKAPS